MLFSKRKIHARKSFEAMKSKLSCEECHGTGEIQGREHELLCPNCLGKKPDWNELMEEVERVINMGGYTCINIDATHTFLHLAGNPNRMLDWKHEDFGGMKETVYRAIMAYREFEKGSRD